jgi:hypothetical protein
MTQQRSDVEDNLKKGIPVPEENNQTIYILS